MVRWTGSLVWMRRIYASMVARAAQPGYVLWVALIAFGVTLTASAPFGPLIVAAVLLQPLRWPLLALCSSAASAVASVTLLWLFDRLPWEQLLIWFPQLASADQVAYVQHWLDAYGLWALLLLAASPVPQTPVLLMVSFSAPSPLWVFLAMWAGKLLKYGGYAWIAARSPERVAQIAERLRNHAR